MNAKTAKQLRKEAGYHPSQPVKYVITKHRRNTTKGTDTREEFCVDPATPKGKYNQLKKQAAA